MYPEGMSSVNASSMPLRQRIGATVSCKDAIPPKMNVFNEDTKLYDRRRGHIHRLNSAPLPELPPISVKPLVEKRIRPLTPLVRNSGRNTSASSRSLPKNYRINLDLTPLVEVGTTWDISCERMRQTSLGSDLELSSESFTSSTSKHRSSLSSSPNVFVEPAPKSSYSTESLEEADGDEYDSSAEEDGKDKMILRWLQSIEPRSNDGTSGELLPSIKEGRLI